VISGARAERLLEVGIGRRSDARGTVAKIGVQASLFRERAIARVRGSNGRI